MSRLSIHFQGIPGWAQEKVLASNIQWVKVIDPPEETPFPGRKIIGRTFIPDGDANALVNLGAEGARQWYARFLPVYQSRSYVYAWEGPNEPQPVSDYAFREKLDEFTFTLSNLMEAGGYHLVGHNWSVGTPEPGTYADMGRSIQACWGWGLHEYSAPAMWDGVGWYCLRYRKAFDELRKAGFQIPQFVFMTETGIDGGVLPNGEGKEKGWKSYASLDEYELQLAWYDEALCMDGITAAFIFTAGPAGQWHDFEVTRSLADWLVEHSWQAEPDGSLNAPVNTAPVNSGTPPPIVNLVGKLRVHPTEKYTTRISWKCVIVHHAVTPSADSIGSELRVKRIAEYHVGHWGWPGIGYSFCIAQDGTVYQTNVLTTISYHAGTKTANKEGVGICLLGTFTKTTPAQVQLDSLTALVKWLKLPIKAHREIIRTGCPGDGWFEQWRIGL